MIVAELLMSLSLKDQDSRAVLVNDEAFAFSEGDDMKIVFGISNISQVTSESGTHYAVIYADRNSFWFTSCNGVQVESRPVMTVAEVLEELGKLDSSAEVVMMTDGHKTEMYPIKNDPTVSGAMLWNEKAQTYDVITGHMIGLAFGKVMNRTKGK